MHKKKKLQKKKMFWAAEACFLESVDIAERVGLKTLIPDRIYDSPIHLQKKRVLSSYRHLAEIYREMGEWDKSLSYYKKVEMALKTTDESEKRLLDLYRQMGMLFFSMGKKESGWEYIKHVEVLSGRIARQSSIEAADIFLLLARCCIETYREGQKEGQLENAVGYLGKAHHMYMEFLGEECPQIAEVYLLFSQVCVLFENEKESEKYKRFYSSISQDRVLKESIFELMPICHFLMIDTENIHTNRDAFTKIMEYFYAVSNNNEVDFSYMMRCLCRGIKYCSTEELEKMHWRNRKSYKDLFLELMVRFLKKAGDQAETEYVTDGYQTMKECIPLLGFEEILDILKYNRQIETGVLGNEIRYKTIWYLLKFAHISEKERAVLKFLFYRVKSYSVPR